MFGRTEAASKWRFVVVACSCAALVAGCGSPSTDRAPSGSTASAPLPSWNDGAVKSAITSFVTKVTSEGGPDFVPISERIAVFDNDGTLWCEQPIYFQVEFALDRVKTMAPRHPEWKHQEPFKHLLSGD